MAPRKPLPDLCLIAVFKFLDLPNQLKASKMNSRCMVLVRAANRKVKTLIITDRNLDYTQLIINSYYISSKPNLQQLTDEGGNAIDFQPNVVRVSKWNSLKYSKNCQEELPTVEEVATVLFSAVTNLTFIINYYTNNCQYLMGLLDHPEWTSQLTSLALSFWSPVSYEVLCYLFSAIDTLTALQQLVLNFGSAFSPISMPDLSIIAQLKQLVLHGGMNMPLSTYMFDIFKRNVADNVDLQVHLHADCTYFFNYCSRQSLISLGKCICSRIVSLIIKAKDLTDDICRLLPMLKSITLEGEFSSNNRRLFTAFSQHNKQLVHLDFEYKEPLATEYLPPSSLPQLNSVRAVTLDLNIRSCSEGERLNLPRTMPNCQAIHLKSFSCSHCRVHLWDYLSGNYSELSHPCSSTALKCLRTFVSKLHPGVQHQRIFLGFEEPYPTAAEVIFDPTSS